MKAAKLLRTVVVTVLLAVLMGCGRSYKFPTASMEPTIRKDAVVWVSYHVPPIHKLRCEIVAFEMTLPHTATPNRYIKRVVGIPGDVIDFHHGSMTVNGSPACIPIAMPTSISRYPMAPTYPFTVSKDHLFLVGDNSPSSFDSRHYGEVPYARVFGTVK